ncbi:MAG: DUF1800 domain-containing protein [Proteobacteria bacterium]|nr:DUF1800 domain-containing protein [Pseudomonadota bacterium]MBI3497118.1 DUF1800 domain-containing protein [Pseudomonadota bacterium]
MTIANAAPEWIALSRMSYGPLPADVARMQRIGLAAYVDEQLAAPPGDDPLTQAMLAAARFPIGYPAGANWPAVRENRPLNTLGKPLADLWQLHLGFQAVTTPWSEVMRATEEVRVATWIRAVHSSYQLREMLCEFWHTHFSVDAFADTEIMATWPAYDRDVIRANALGNFRQLLEAVGTSTAMMFFLNNQSSRASHPNENYARELLELHTLGRPNYYDHQYASWDQVPLLPTGEPIGFIDDDVFGAAKALSGWTIDPANGSFLYVPRYHSRAAARVLGIDLASFTADLAAGRKVFDLAAYHPKTAAFVCGKLCQRLYGENAPQSLVDKAVATWLANSTAPDQIAQVLRTILNAPEFLQNPGIKLRRPFELLVGFLRAVGAVATPSWNLMGGLESTGYRMFSWPTPDGLPDTNAHWLTTDTTLRTWNLLLGMFGTTILGGQAVLASQLPAGTNTVDSILAFWSQAMLGGNLSASSYAALLSDAMSADGIGPAIGGRASAFEAALRRLVALIATTPEFVNR